MSSTRPKILYLVGDAFEDLRRSFRDVRLLYFMLMLWLVGFVAAVSLPGLVASPDGTIPPEQMWVLVPAVGLLFVSLLGMVPSVIGMTRYFIADDRRYGYRLGRPFWRVLGWTILLTIALIPVVALIAIVTPYLAPAALPTGQPHPRFIAAIFLVIVACSAVAYWLVARLLTFYGALALDERNAVLRRSFRETRGHAWYIILNLIVWSAASSSVFIIALYLAGFGWGISFSVDTLLFFGQGFFPLTTVFAIVCAIAAALLLVALIGLQIALYGRTFRAVRSAGAKAVRETPPSLPSDVWNEAPA